MSDSLRPRRPAGVRSFASALWLSLALGAAAPAAGAELRFVSGSGLTTQGVQLLALLQDASSFGLRTRDYDLGFDATLMARELAPGKAAHVDEALATAALRFVTHLHCGRVSPGAVGFQLPAPPCTVDARSVLEALATASDVRATAASFEPRVTPYRRLAAALPRYRELAARMGAPAVPALPKRSLAAGDEYAGAPALRTLLIALGDLDAAAAGTDRKALRIDDALAAGVAAFQRRHGLEPDGALGERTLAELNRPLSERVRQIELTLERWRWLGALERPDILVNVPHFMLYALPRPEHPQEALIEMPVIVGQSSAHTRTPVFVSKIQHVVFRPYWDVPTSITQRELLPLIREDPSYLERHHMELVRGQADRSPVVAPTPENIDALAAGELRLRQRPGEDNALGPVKFVLPNPYNVFLHSTPQERLFERTTRAFSHGCIRVSEPERLAQYVLENNAPGDWNETSIYEAMCGPPNVRVDLVKPVRVVIFYATAVATAEGQVHFARDIYGYDAKLARLIDR